MRNTTILLLGFIIAIGLSACGGNTIGEPPSPTPDTRALNTLEPGDVNLNPFATELPPEAELPDNSANIGATLQAFGAPIQPTAEATVPLFGGIEVPEEQPKPGVVNYAEATEDPEIGAIFDQVTLIRGGGVNSEILQIDLYQDGTLWLNSEVIGNVGAQQVIAFDNLLDEVNFFGIRGSFSAAITDSDIYQYNITVSRAGSSLTLNADDTLIPPELQRLVQTLLDFTFGVQQAPQS